MLGSSMPVLAQPVPEAGTTVDPSTGFADLVEQVTPAVVSVHVKRGGTELSSDERSPFNFDQFDNPFPEDSPFHDFFEQFRNQPNSPRFRAPRQRQQVAQGSGFVISEDGYIVTNNHVVDHGQEIQVSFIDGREYTAEIIGTDPKTDLALLKIDTDDKLAYVRFAEEPARVGDWVIAVGNPFGLGGSVTTGIVSARGRDIGAGPYDDFIQLDAPINRGNSGGPAFNLRGEVIGVNTAIFSPSGGNVGIGFAIPAATVKEVVEDLMDDGAVTRGWLGVQIQSVTEDIAEGLGLEAEQGAIVAEVMDDSPAAAAGLQVGDTVLRLDGEDVKDSRDLARKVARLRPGQNAEFEILRDGERQTVTVEIGLMPGDTQQVAKRQRPGDQRTSLDALGLTVAPADGEGQGVVITRVKPDSPAAEKGLQPGDQIVEVAGKAVTVPGDVESGVEAARENGRKSVLMLVRSGDNRRFVALPVEQG